LDNLTHTLTGLLLSRAGFRRLSPRAAWIAMLGANAPDVDVLAAAWGPAAYLDYHRHFTHSLAAVPLIAALPLLPFLRSAGWRDFLVSLAAVLSHVLMDFANVYGIRLGWPFSDRWMRLDTTPVIDVWILLFYALALAAPALSRLVSSEIGEARRHRATGTGWAVFALTLMLGYQGGRAVAHQRALAMVEPYSYDGEVPQTIAALPNPFSPLRWRALVRLSDHYRVLDVDLLFPLDPSSGEAFFMAEPGPWRDAAAATPSFQAFLRFNQFPLWQVTPAPDEGARVRLFDLRFGSPRAPGFVATAVVDRGHRVRESSFSFGIPRIR
jgi:inner membrane protein